jgi:glycosyltransferase involved in cell wall biosynthesis
MSLSIVTPSLDMLPFLKCCAASVSDQEGVRAEHIVIDGGSRDGTADWLAAQTGIGWISEKDRGMYDAVNKGLRLAGGELLAYLNCDEQYLPGTLAFAREFFANNPGTDILFGDFLVTRPDGSLVAYRKSFAPKPLYIYASFLYTYTCTMFLRRRIIDDGFWFDPRLRVAGDAEWLLRVLRAGYVARHVRRYLSVFIDSGANASRGKAALAAARREFRPGMPAWLQAGRWLVNGVRLLEKAWRGNYRQGALEYDMYAVGGPGRRSHFAPRKATFRWRNG